MAAFSAISAIAGGIELLLWPHGNAYVPIQLLERSPFSSFLVPGLLLGFVVGGTSLACAWLTWRSSHAALDATILAGGTLSAWILAEAGIMREVEWLHAVYGTLGATILWLGVSAAWRTGSPRHRWVISVTFAETIGYLAPAYTGILATKAGLSEPVRAGLLTVAGLVEGLALGLGQAWAFPFALRRGRYALLSALGAGLVWACVMGMMLVIGTGNAPLAVSVLAGMLTALVGLASIGSLQWLELRHHVDKAYRWIPWTALAWSAALPLSFTPGPFVDELTPLASHFVLWGCGGWLMAYGMALITWQGVRRLGAGNSSPDARRLPHSNLVGLANESV